jgi:16S rRNA (cytidine1402-2'-O)-methyltransferase
MLKDAREILGEREIVIAREVTKVHEQFLRGTIGATLEYLKRRPAKGEITVLIGLHVVSDADGGVPPARSIISEIQAVMAGRKVDERVALKIVARARGVSKSEAYRLFQTEKNRKS